MISVFGNKTNRWRTVRPHHHLQRRLPAHHFPLSPGQRHELDGAISSGLGLLIEIWKITKAMDVSVDVAVFPFVHFKDKHGYEKSDTAKHDEVAMRYLSYALYPLVGCYAVYSVVYNEHKGWYSFVLTTLVGAVYLFGFITMCPQLYINYKLKSVAHLP